MSGDDPDAILDRLGFDAEASVLTRRQAQVLVLRERGRSQVAIAERLGTSRANVSGVENSARENVRKARETVAFADALTSPIRVTVEAGTDLYDVPRTVFDAADEAGVRVNYTAPELMTLITEEAADAVDARRVQAALVIGVSREGEVSVRRERARE